MARSEQQAAPSSSAEQHTSSPSREPQESGDASEDTRPVPKSIHEYGPSQVFSPVGPVSQNAEKIQQAVRMLQTRYISLWQLGLMSAAMQLFLFTMAPEQAIDGAHTVVSRIANNVQYWAPCLLATFAIMTLKRNRTVTMIDQLFQQIAVREQTERLQFDRQIRSATEKERRRYQREIDVLNANLNAKQMQLVAERAQAGVYRDLFEQSRQAALGGSHGGVPPAAPPHPQFASPLTGPPRPAPAAPAGASEPRSVLARAQSQLETYFGSPDEAASLFCKLRPASATASPTAKAAEPPAGSAASKPAGEFALPPAPPTASAAAAPAAAPSSAPAAGGEAASLGRVLGAVAALEAETRAAAAARREEREEGERLRAAWLAREASLAEEHRRRAAEATARADKAEAALRALAALLAEGGGDRAERVGEGAVDKGAVEREQSAAPAGEAAMADAAVKAAQQRPPARPPSCERLLERRASGRTVAFGDEEARAVVLEVLAEKTGFLSDAIELEMELEADLLLASHGEFARHELVAELQRRLALEVQDTRRLTGAKRVRELVDAMTAELAWRSLPPSPHGSLKNVRDALPGQARDTSPLVG